jgi:serine/tyrosine/threonine adenylyltransferase
LSILYFSTSQKTTFVLLLHKTMSSHTSDSTDSFLLKENSYLKLPEFFYSKVQPSIVPRPILILFNPHLAEELNLKEAPTFYTPFLSGNKIVAESSPIAMAYAGHQFGHFTMLGDGRAILLGEMQNKHQQKVDIQLKGAGQTPYSRNGDGKATLSAMLREYLISEAMHHLGIATTRSLAVVATGSPVIRQNPEHGAVLTRVAKSHIRVGTFEFASHFHGTDAVKKLADYTIQRHFPHLFSTENPYLGLLNTVIENQASLIADWMKVGFIHGVMNTDNMSIAGETIDYGPCAFMNTYNPNTVFSSIDTQGRYAYSNQPHIAQWNLSCFANTLLPLLNDKMPVAVEMASQSVLNFKAIFEQKWLHAFSLKIGIQHPDEKDKTRIEILLEWMAHRKLDFTNTFLDLGKEQLPELPIYEDKNFKLWHIQWQKRLEEQGISLREARAIMKKNNPMVIPRNHLVEEALAIVNIEGEFTPFRSLLNTISKPFSYFKGIDKYQNPPEDETNYKTYCGT